MTSLLKVFRPRWVVAACAGLYLLETAAPSLSESTAYKATPGDVVQITVYGDSDLSGRFAVDRDGSITYPLVGSVSVVGMTMPEIGQLLGKTLSERLPSVSVTAAISEYAPVFVVGEVRNPGKYQYRPGMITLELIALAGGVGRLESPLDGSAFQLLNARQEYVDLDLQIFAQRARRQRLRAELDEAELSFPAPLDADPDVRQTEQQILDGELELFQIRKRGLISDEQALQAQENSYSDEIRTIEKSTVLHNQEIALLDDDVATTRKLVERGLTATSNLRQVERDLSATKRDALELRTYLARAEQNRLAIQQRRSALVDQRRNEAAAAIQDIDLNVARMTKRQQALISSMTEIAASARQTHALAADRKTVMSVLRSTDGVSYDEISADDRSQIKPGDILRIEFNIPFSGRQAGVEQARLPFKSSAMKDQTTTLQEPATSRR